METKKNKVFPITIGLEHHSHDAALPSYQELDLFREHLEQQRLGPKHQPYQTHQKQALFYRLAFAGMGLLFLLFCGIIYTKSMAWTHTLFFQDGHFFKTTLYCFCGTLSTAAFWIASQIRPEKEAIANLRKRTRNLLRKLYHERIMTMGVKRFLPQGKHQNEVVVIKHHFHHALDSVEHAVAVTRQLILMISTSTIVSYDMRVKLFNQALLELQDKLHFIVQNYQ